YVVPTGRVIVATGRTGRDHDGGVIILPQTTAEEHIAVQKESNARTTLLQSILDDHIADFHYMDDARDIWNAVKARFGGNAESKKIRKSMLKQEFLEFKIGEAEGLHKGYARMQKILSQLNQLKAKPEDEDINLKFLRALPSSWSQVALTLKTKGRLEFLSFDNLYYKLKNLEVDVKGYTNFPSSQSVGPSHSAFVSATSASKKMSYRDSLSYSSNTTYSASSNSKTGKMEGRLTLIRRNLLGSTRRRLDATSVNKEAILPGNAGQRKEMTSKDIPHSKSRDWKKEEDSKALITVDTLVDWTDHDDEGVEVITSKEFGLIAGCDSEDAIKEGAAKIYNLITEANSEEANTASDAGEFALMGVTFKLTLEDKIRVLSIELENTSNLLKHSERINDDFETAKKDLQTKLDNHLVQTEKWRNSSKNMFRLINSSMSVRTKVGLGFTNCISENELGWDDSAFSVLTTNSEDVEGRPIFHSDKSFEVNTNDFASSDSSVKSSKHQPNDSTSCASTSSVSTSVNEAEIESNVGTPIQEPIIVQDLPSHFRKHASSVSKLCFVCGNATHLIKDCDFHEKQMANKTVGIGVGSVYNTIRPQPVPTGKPKVSTPVPTGKTKVSTPVLTGRPNRPFPFPNDKGFSPSDIWATAIKPSAEDGDARLKKYSELSSAEAIQADCD
nr:xylulose kinase-1 [Tanacetum cinerariifolium]